MPIQRGKELRRRRTRRKKVAKLRQRYAAARSEAERAAILEKLSKCVFRAIVIAHSDAS
jgi:hypothetical protein